MSRVGLFDSVSRANSKLECRKFTVDIENGENGWLVAQCRELPEAMTQGRTLEEVRSNIAEVIALILEERKSKALNSPLQTIEVAV